jgi:hypothetical protein
MSFLTRLFGKRKTVARKRENAAPVKQGRGYAASAGRTPYWSGFHRRNRDSAKLAEYGAIYLTGGPVRTAIDVRPRFAWSQGYSLEGADPAEVDAVQKRLDDMNIRRRMQTALVDAQVYGNGIIEMVLNRGEGLADLANRPSAQFDIEWDEYGIITRYIQHTNPGSADGDIVIPPERIIDITLSTFGGSPYGVSLIGSAYDDIMRDVDVVVGLSRAIKRHGTPKYHVAVGAPGEDIPQETITFYKTNFADIESDNEFVTCADVKINGIDVSGVGNVAEYNNASLQRMAAALNVPEEVLGLGRGSTEATANVRLDSFLYEIENIQEDLNHIINTRVIDMLTGKPGAVRFKLHSPRPADVAAADYVVKVLTANPVDPYGMFGTPEAGKAWARAKLHITAPITDTDDIDEDTTPDGMAGTDRPETPAQEDAV